MLSVLVLLLVVAAASFAYRAFWMLRARPSSRYVGSRFRDEVVAMSRRQRRRAFWGNVLLCVLCVAAMVLVGVLVGVVSMGFRYYGVYETGVCFALLAVNSVSAWIDRTEAKLYHLTHLQADAGKGAAQ